MEYNFELKPAEIAVPIAFREGGRKFRVSHVFRAPSFGDWLEYETKLNRSVEIQGSHTRFDQDRADAAEAIWDRIALRVEGYLLSSAGEEHELTDAEPDSWREKVPLLHKMASIQLLAQVFPGEFEEIEEYRFDPDRTEVHLIAARGSREFTALAHILRRPTVRQQKEFSRIVSSALYVRGSRNERSLLPSRLREMVRFYDQLVVGVKGYSVEGSSASREDAIQWMDALHKQTAVSALFNFDDTGDAIETE